MDRRLSCIGLLFARSHRAEVRCDGRLPRCMDILLGQTDGVAAMGSTVHATTVLASSCDVRAASA
jgi:hypothetical protein